MAPQEKEKAIQKASHSRIVHRAFEICIDIDATRPDSERLFHEAPQRLANELVIDLVLKRSIYIVSLGYIWEKPSEGIYSSFLFK